MAETADNPSHASDSLPSFVSNLFPFLKPKPPHVDDVSSEKDPRNSTFETVSFPYNPSNNVEPLKFEAEVSSGRTSNSVVLWQVYALGGFLVLKWAWARWNERNERSGKKEALDDDDDDDDDQPSHQEDDDDQPSHGHVS